MRHLDDSADGVVRADCFDLLAPHVAELCGGSMREHSEERLRARLAHLSPTVQQKLDWLVRFIVVLRVVIGELMPNIRYASLRHYGYGPMGGFGLGFDRLLQCLLGVNKIHDVIPFPRCFNLCKC